MVVSCSPTYLVIILYFLIFNRAPVFSHEQPFSVLVLLFFSKEHLVHIPGCLKHSLCILLLEMVFASYFLSFDRWCRVIWCNVPLVSLTVIRAKVVGEREVDSGNDIYGNPIKRIQYDVKQIKVRIH